MSLIFLPDLGLFCLGELCDIASHLAVRGDECVFSLGLFFSSKFASIAAKLALVFRVSSPVYTNSGKNEVSGAEGGL